MEDHGQACVGPALRVGEYLAHLRDIGFLSADNEPTARPDFGLQFERASLADTALDLLLNLNEQRLEAIEVLASLAVGDLFSCTLIGAGTYMAEFGDIGCSCCSLQFWHQLIFVHRF